MKIVILDGYTLNPGDLSWDGFSDLAQQCQVYDHTLAADVVSRCQDYDIVLTNKTVLSADVIKRLPRLNILGYLLQGPMLST